MAAPDGGTTVRTVQPDGRLASVTGSAVVPQYYAYDTDPSTGFLTSWVYSGTDGRSGTSGQASGRWQKKVTDWLGRAVHVERPGFSPSGQAAYTEDSSYDDAGGTGRLLATTRSGLAPIRYEYDELSNMVRSGLSLSGSTLVNASQDRIQESEQFFYNDGTIWWLRQETRTYPKLNDPTRVITSATLKRLTGFPANRLEETQVTDAEGNTAIRTVDVNPATATTTVTTTRPGSANPETTTLVNGLATSATGHDGLTRQTLYDALSRAYQTIDSRGLKTTALYKYGSTLGSSVVDSATNTVSTIAYDGLGRKQWVQDAAGQYTRFAYNARGQLQYQWGGASYPVQYDYDATYGDRTRLYTFRSAPAGDSAAWPGGGTADTTTWNYDGATGLLSQKVDAASQVTSFDYDSLGRTRTRTWARSLASNGGVKLASTYNYDSNTGELRGVAYNDGGDPIPTPAVSYSYTRLGQVATVGDVTGSRTFNYDSSSPWRLTTETLDASFYAARVLTRNYDSASGTGGAFGGYTPGTFKGRYTGYDLGVAGNPARDQHLAYTTSSLAQFVGVTSRITNGASRDTIYNYTPNTSLLGGYSTGSVTVLRGYDGSRNLLTSIETRWGGNADTVSHTYSYNALGQRQTAQLGGSAFADYWQGQSYTHVYNAYTYNARGELQTGAMYRGDTASPTPASTDELPGRRFEYRFDSLGNRTSAGETGVSTARGGADDTYAVNALNQYTGKDNHTVRVLGTAAPAATVAVASAPSTGKLDNAWGADLLPANTAGPVQDTAKVYAAFPGKGSGGLDLIRSDSKGYCIAAAAQSFTYDLDGNLTGDGVWTYTYNAENQLVSLTTTAAAVAGGLHNRLLQFRYDYLGRRVQKRSVDFTAGTDATQRYVFDGWNAIAETDTGGNLQRAFAWGLDLAGSLTGSGGVGALLQITDLVAGKTLCPAYDGNGNITGLLNADSGATEAAYEYDPSGNLLRCEGTYAKSNPFRFSTKWQDDETGLLYYGYRYYSAQLGRFVCRDPEEESGGINLYAFLQNNAISKFDYLGLDEKSPPVVLPPIVVHAPPLPYVPGNALPGTTNGPSIDRRGGGNGNGIGQTANKTLNVIKHTLNKNGKYDIYIFIDDSGSGKMYFRDVATGAVTPMGEAYFTGNASSFTIAPNSTGTNGTGSTPGNGWDTGTAYVLPSITVGPNNADSLKSDATLPGGGMPKGWDPSWPSGSDPRGPFVQDPNGPKWYPHPEDDGHWPHWDREDNQERYPPNSKKPWPGQKRPPYEDQSDKNPWPQPPTPQPAPLITGSQVAGGVAVIGTGYLIYRVVRMTPSVVLPPLWPTIPANAVIP